MTEGTLVQIIPVVFLRLPFYRRDISKWNLPSPSVPSFATLDEMYEIRMIRLGIVALQEEKLRVLRAGATRACCSVTRREGVHALLSVRPQRYNVPNAF